MEGELVGGGFNNNEVPGSALYSSNLLNDTIIGKQARHSNHTIEYVPVLWLILIASGNNFVITKPYGFSKSWYIAFL